MKLVLGIVAALMLLLPVVSANYLYLYPQSDIIRGFTAMGCGVNSFECVNEVSIDTSDYVYTSANKVTDSYSLSNHLAFGTISQVNIIHTAKRYSTNKFYLYSRLSTGGSPVYHSLGGGAPLSAAYADYTTNYTMSPFTSSAWTWSEINNLQVGIMSAQYLGGGYVARVRVRVTYTP